MNRPAKGLSLYALDPDRLLAFMYDPLEGLSIPLVLDAPRGKLRVEYPSVDDIHHNFSVFLSLEAMIEFAPGLARQIRKTADLDRNWSDILSDLIEDDETTTTQLHYAIQKVRAGDYVPRRSTIGSWTEAQDEATIAEPDDYAEAQDYSPLKTQMY